MADRRAKAVTASAKPTALVGSAQILAASRVNAPRNIQWQQQAWSYWRSHPEPSFATLWIGHAYSRCRLYVARRPRQPGDDPEPVTDGPAVDLLASLGGGLLGQQQLLHSFGVHLSVPGIGYLTGRQAVGAFDSWQVLSADELRVQGRGYEVQVGEQEWEKAPPDTLVVKVWRPDEQFHWRPWSPMQPVLSVLNELDGLSKKIDADIVSRLASAGIILIPSEVEFPVRPEFQDADDPLMAEIIEVVSTAIKDRASAAANVPVFIRVPAEYVDKIKHLTWTTPLDSEAIKLREEARGRFAVGMDMPAEILTGLGDVNHWCVDAETEILTQDGWMSHDELSIGDTVLTLNHESGLSEWQPVEDIYRADVVGEPMMAIKGAYHSSLTTPNHRWPVIHKRQHDGAPMSRDREWATSKTLTHNEFFVTGAPHADLPTEPKWSDAFVELVAWLWTEGTINVRPGRLHPKVRIYQSHTANPDNVARIRRAFTMLYGPQTEGPIPSSRRGPLDPVPKWHEYQRTQGTTCFAMNIAAAAPLVEIAPNRVVDLGFIRELTESQLELFIDTSMRADGHIHKNGRRVLSQSDPKRLPALELAAVLSGCSYSSRVGEHEGFRRHTMYHVSIQRRTVFGPKSKHKQQEQYSGTIWCPTTRNGSWFARRRGQTFYTGNSAWHLDEQAVQYHVTPGMEAICQGLSIGYLVPALQVLGESDPELVIWFDASELTTRPDLSTNTQALYDRFEVSPSTLRRETGVNESDAPTPDELKIMVVKKALSEPRLLADPALAKALFEEVGIILPTVTPAEVPGQPDGTQPPAEVTPPNSPPATPQDVNPPPPAVAASANGHTNVALVAAADGLVCRALEKAGNRVRQKVKPAKGAANDCPPLTIHECLGGVGACGIGVPTLLAGAWDRVPDIAARLHVDPVWLAQSLELYAAGLLDSGSAHTWEGLEGFLVAEMALV